MAISTSELGSQKFPTHGGHLLDLFSTGIKSTPGSSAEHVDLLKAKKDHRNTRNPQTMISGIPLYWAFEPTCEILMFLSSLGPLLLSSHSDSPAGRVSVHAQQQIPASPSCIFQARRIWHLYCAAQLSFNCCGSFFPCTAPAVGARSWPKVGSITEVFYRLLKGL